MLEIRKIHIEDNEIKGLCVPYTKSLHNATFVIGGRLTFTSFLDEGDYCIIEVNDKYVYLAETRGNTYSAKYRHLVSIEYLDKIQKMNKSRLH